MVTPSKSWDCGVHLLFSVTGFGGVTVAACVDASVAAMVADCVDPAPRIPCGDAVPSANSRNAPHTAQTTRTMVRMVDIFNWIGLLTGWRNDSRRRAR